MRCPTLLMTAMVLLSAVLVVTSGQAPPSQGKTFTTTPAPPSQGKTSTTTPDKDCGKKWIHTSPSFSILNYTDDKYANNLNCHWTIDVNASQFIKLTFKGKFELEKPDQNGNCSYDSITVYDLSNDGSRLKRGTWCGTTAPPLMVSSTSKMEVVFQSDESNVYNGFLATFEKLDDRVCGGVVKSSEDIIKHPKIGNKYSNAEFCDWTIDVDKGYGIEIYFLHFELEKADKEGNCSYDRLSVNYDGNVLSWCGTSIPHHYTFNTSTVHIQFQSDETVVRSGFSLFWSKVVKPSCHKNLKAGTGEIGNNYFGIKTATPCRWDIMAKTNEFIQLQFLNFSLTNTMGKCDDDYIEIFDVMGNTSLIKRGHWCGKIPPLIMTSFGNQMVVTFHAVDTVHYTEKPFTAVWTSVKKCGEQMLADQGHIMSYNYPLKSKTQCEWQIILTHGYHMKMVITCLSTQKVCEDLKITEFSSEKTDFVNGTNHFSSLSNHVNISLTKSDNGIAFYASWKAFCGETHKEKNGTLRLLEHMDGYGNNMYCEWEIIGADNHVINLTFVDDFDIEAKEGKCEYDYVEIFEVIESNRVSKGKFCGNKKPGPLISYFRKIVVVFCSDVDKNGKGFSLNWNSEKQCGGQLRRDVGRLSFPDIKNKKAVNCTWIIYLKPYLHSVEFQIGKFDTKNGSLKITGTDLNGTEFDHPITENITTLSFLEIKSPLMVNLILETGHNSTSFEFTWKGVCRRTFNSLNGQFSSPQENSLYPNNINCVWVIKKQENKMTSLSFTMFDLEEGQKGKCRFDYVKVVTSTTNKSAIEGHDKFCGNQFPKNVISSKTLEVRFHSDISKSGAGFKAKFEIACGSKHEEDSGTITSPNYPNHYANNLNCSWTIVVTAGKTIMLTFNSTFHIQRKKNTCPDYLKVCDGNLCTKESQLGKEKCGKKEPSTIRSASSQMTIIFISDNTRNYTGFKASWKAVCGKTYSKPNGTITSLGYDKQAKYANNEFCQWKIILSPNEIIQLHFGSFDLEEDHVKCNYDYVKVYDIMSNGTTKSRGKWCGYQAPPDLFSFSSSLMIEFITDGSKGGTGFNLTWEKESLNNFRGTLKKDKGFIMSPNYPQHYPDNVYSEWKIDLQNGINVTLTFDKTFDIETDEDGECAFDYVEVLDVKKKSLAKLCGNDKKNPLQIHGPFWIIFKSDKGNVGDVKGFFVSWE